MVSAIGVSCGHICPAPASRRHARPRTRLARGRVSPPPPVIEPPWLTLRLPGRTALRRQRAGSHQPEPTALRFKPEVPRTSRRIRKSNRREAFAQRRRGRREQAKQKGSRRGRREFRTSSLRAERSNPGQAHPDARLPRDLRSLAMTKQKPTLSLSISSSLFSLLCALCASAPLREPCSLLPRLPSASPRLRVNPFYPVTPGPTRGPASSAPSPKKFRAEAQRAQRVQNLVIASGAKQSRAGPPRIRIATRPAVPRNDKAETDRTPTFSLYLSPLLSSLPSAPPRLRASA